MKKTILLFVMLTACQQKEQVEEPVIANVPVTVACHAEAIPEPEWNVVQLATNASPEDELKAVLVDLDLSHGIIEELKAELAACS